MPLSDYFFSTRSFALTHSLSLSLPTALSLSLPSSTLRPTRDCRLTRASNTSFSIGLLPSTLLLHPLPRSLLILSLILVAIFFVLRSSFFPLPSFTYTGTHTAHSLSCFHSLSLAFPSSSAAAAAFHSIPRSIPRSIHCFCCFLLLCRVLALNIFLSFSFSLSPLFTSLLHPAFYCHFPFLFLFFFFFFSST